MWLVVGLGNPGPRYAGNRHNIGFMVVDELARAMPAWSDKHGAQTTSGMVGGERTVLLKPMEFMNTSGVAVQRAAQFHKVAPTAILVVHDELDLPFSVLRLKSGGGHGGHNGLRSITEQLGDKYARLRMGIGRPPDPRPPAAEGARALPGAKDAAGWVLADFGAVQRPVVRQMIDAACADIAAVVASGITAAMNAHNGRPPLAPT